jgi:hypothetical protein
MSEPLHPWLLLIHQLPPKPAYLRVKVWRRLQGLGAVAIRSSVYALPASEQALEDFMWLLREITDGGGEGSISEARFVGGLDDAAVRALFDAAREADYRALAEEAREVAREAPEELAPKVARLRRRLAEIVAIDFFGAPGREAAEALVAALEPRGAGASAGSAPMDRGRVWVTRQGVGVDRIASAWLIRRFIDPEARFRFVPALGHVPEPGEIRFDMFEAEYTHEGDRCTFETLLARHGLDDPGLARIGEIVHDLDLKDAKHGRAETAGVGAVIDGIVAAIHDDAERLARGAQLLDDLHAALARPAR